MKMHEETIPIIFSIKGDMDRLVRKPWHRQGVSLANKIRDMLAITDNVFATMRFEKEILIVDWFGLRKQVVIIYSFGEGNESCYLEVIVTRRGLKGKGVLPKNACMNAS